MKSALDFKNPSIFHMKYTPATGDQQVTFHVSLNVNSGATDPSLSWNLYVRRGQPVTFTTETVMGMPLPSVAHFDYSFTAQPATEADIVIDANSNPPFDPTKDYYLVFTQQDCPTAKATVSIASSPPGNDAGASDGASDGATAEDGAATADGATVKASEGWLQLSTCGARVAHGKHLAAVRPRRPLPGTAAAPSVRPPVRSLTSHHGSK